MSRAVEKLELEKICYVTLARAALALRALFRMRQQILGAIDVMLLCYDTPRRYDSQ